MLIPFFAFALGANIDLGTVWQAGLLGIGLGVFVVMVTGTVLFFTDRLTGGNGTAGLAAASTAGNAAAGPGDRRRARTQPTSRRRRARPSWWRRASWSPRSWCRSSPPGGTGASRRARRCALATAAARSVVAVTDVTVIADDLTGAADCGTAFALAGLPTFVSIGNAPAPDSAQIVSVDTDTRRLAPDEAARQAGEAARDAYRRGTRTLYKKIDSTLRGHVAGELAATFRAAAELAGGEPPLVVFAPAFPGTGADAPRRTPEGRAACSWKRPRSGESRA